MVKATQEKKLFFSHIEIIDPHHIKILPKNKENFPNIDFDSFSYELDFQ